MNRIFAVIGAVVIVLALFLVFHKKKPVIDPQRQLVAVTEAVTRMNTQLPIHIGVDLILTKAIVVGNQVEFDYLTPYPAKMQLPPRTTGLMRGSMVQYACGIAAARSILDAGFNINHRALDDEGHELFATIGDAAVCANF
jgi:hypothetical protein